MPMVGARVRGMPASWTGKLVLAAVTLHIYHAIDVISGIIYLQFREREATACSYAAVVFD